MQLYYLYIASALLIAIGYMLFDVLNRREVPNLFAYSALVFSFVVILLSGNWHLALQSYLIAFAILGFGYFIYRIGQLGLGDVFEFAALSLLLSPLPAPLMARAVPLAALPPVVSLLLDTGVAAVIIVPAFYICVAVRRFGGSAAKGIRREEVLKAVVVVASYIVLAALISRIAPAKTLFFAVLFLVVLGSALLLLFQRAITEVMVERVGVSGFTEDDIIAFNLMTGRELASAKRAIRSFDRLVTKEMIAEMRRKKVRQKFPVYKRAVPFGVPIFFGALLTILFGNILLVALVG
jgi:Flp pilus assembly protein protease CpaA